MESRPIGTGSDIQDCCATGHKALRYIFIAPLASIQLLCSSHMDVKLVQGVIFDVGAHEVG